MAAFVANVGAQVVGAAIRASADVLARATNTVMSGVRVVQTVYQIYVSLLQAYLTQVKLKT